MDEARKLGLSQVLMTCDTDNPASALVTKKDGGVLAARGFQRLRQTHFPLLDNLMNPLNRDYICHDLIYQRLKAEGAYGWTSEEDHAQVVRPRILQAIEQLSIPSGGRILDLGCGTGDIAIWLGLQGYEAHGIDIAPSAIAWANEKAKAQ